MSNSNRPPLGLDARGGPVQVFFSPTGARRRPVIDRAEGIYMWDSDGRRYIDATSGPVACNLGHGDPQVIEALVAQARRVCFAFPSIFESEANAALADLLADLAGPGLERAFFVSGGSEANESAIKLARQYAVAKGEAQRRTIIARDPSYHGATLGALAVSGDPVSDAMFGPLMRIMPKVPAPFTYRVPAGHTAESWAEAAADALERQIIAQGPETVLAFIMEPIGGLSTGALVAPDAYYRRVRQICDRYGVLLIYDEIMCGAGRTGAFLAAHHWPAARPDIVTLAKGISAGYAPMGVMLAPRDMVAAVADSGGFAHAYTYFTNPLTCAVGLAVLRQVVARKLTENAACRGVYLRRCLEALMARSPIVGDVRGKGLLMAIELVADKQSKAMIPLPRMAPYRIAELAFERGLLQYVRRTANGKYGDWLMITPPLIVTDAQIDEIVGLLGESLDAFTAELHGNA
ncbi:MAG TPA: aminotransferase class III-fold pyridoxal phosphate-dependent enzyme [Kiloniellales bacterium]